jgi:hypothetical protein
MKIKVTFIKEYDYDELVGDSDADMYDAQVRAGELTEEYINDLILQGEGNLASEFYFDVD